MFEVFLGRLLNIDPGTIYTTHIAKVGNFDVRMTQSPRARETSFRVALVPNEEDLQPVITQARRLAAERNRGSSILVISKSPSGWQPRWGAQPDGKGVRVAHRTGDMSPLRDIPGFVLHHYEYRPADPANANLLVAGGAPRTSRIATIPPVVDPRIHQMLRTAIASSKAVMLVGPPGTGKSTLVEEIVRECGVNPGAYGMTYPHRLLTVTPEESWSSRDLIGDFSPDAGGHLKFAPGHVLRAISADKWLLLDEANRANLDTIFGALLTFLCGQQVTVGRESPGSATEIVLSWSEQPSSGIDRTGTVYSAGQEWRLLGTYNSLDADKVFRMGYALDRRFAKIPIAPPPPEKFRDIVRPRLETVLEGSIGEHVADVIARIYEIHATSKHAVFGPAPFLSILDYVGGGIEVGRLDLSRALDPCAINGLVAEAYVSGFGTWLGRLDDKTVDDLGARLRRDDALGSQWDWVRKQYPTLA